MVAQPFPHLQRAGLGVWGCGEPTLEVTGVITAHVERRAWSPGFAVAPVWLWARRVRPPAPALVSHFLRRGTG